MVSEHPTSSSVKTHTGAGGFGPETRRSVEDRVTTTTKGVRGGYGTKTLEFESRANPIVKTFLSVLAQNDTV